MPTPYAQDELTGVLNRDESVSLDRLAATVVDLMSGLDIDRDDDDNVGSQQSNDKPKPMITADRAHGSIPTAKLPAKR